MFYNVGRSIKLVAKIFFWAGLFLSVLGFMWGMTMSIVKEDFVLLLSSFILLILGIFLSWLSAILLYGFGSLIMNTAFIAENTKKEDLESDYDPYY